MTTLEDAELLRRYKVDHTEAAFAELVRRHVSPVYAFALRQVGGDAHLAQDVTQLVFLALARKAAALAERPVLGGLLCRTTHFAARDIVRAERRRRAREEKAHLMQETSDESGPAIDWDKLHPVLDRLLGELNDADRDAVWLRFFEGRSFAEVGARLRLTENAARMRVERALDKLHAVLAQRGITSTASAIGAALAQQASIAAPAGLGATVTSAALAGGTTTAGGTALFMSINTRQIGIAGVAIAAGATVFGLQMRTNAELRREINMLETQQAELAALQAENRRLASTLAEVEQLRHEDAEFQQLAQTAQQLKEAQAARAARSAPAPGRRRSEEFVQKLLADDQRAQEEVIRMEREIDALLEEASRLPVEAARQKAVLIETRQRDLQRFITNVRKALTLSAETGRATFAQNGEPLVIPADFPKVGGPNFARPPDAVAEAQPPTPGTSPTDRRVITKGQVEPPTVWISPAGKVITNGRVEISSTVGPTTPAQPPQP